jgi:hypothetical protein
MSILKRKVTAAAKPKPETVNIARLTKVQLVMILAAAGARITEAEIVTDQAEGAPTNPDGTFNLINYAAWLASLAD